VIVASMAWEFVPQHACVVLPDGTMRYVVDPRMVPAIVTLYEPSADRYTVAHVNSRDQVTVLLPELPDAVSFLSGQFTVEEIR
jgi:hypothetical protein